MELRVQEVRTSDAGARSRRICSAAAPAARTSGNALAAARVRLAGGRLYQVKVAFKPSEPKFDVTLAHANLGRPIPPFATLGPRSSALSTAIIFSEDTNARVEPAASFELCSHNESLRHITSRFTTDLLLHECWWTSPWTTLKTALTWPLARDGKALVHNLCRPLDESRRVRFGVIQVWRTARRKKPIRNRVWSRMRDERRCRGTTLSTIPESITAGVQSHYEHHSAGSGRPGRLQVILATLDKIKRKEPDIQRRMNHLRPGLARAPRHELWSAMKMMLSAGRRLRRSPVLVLLAQGKGPYGRSDLIAPQPWPTMITSRALISDFRAGILNAGAERRSGPR